MVFVPSVISFESHEVRSAFQMKIEATKRFRVVFFQVQVRWGDRTGRHARIRVRILLEITKRLRKMSIDFAAPATSRTMQESATLKKEA